MAKTVLIAVTLTLMLVNFFQQSTSHPLRKRDLIDGSDFLSLFINSGTSGSLIENETDPNTTIEDSTTTKISAESKRNESFTDFDEIGEIDSFPKLHGSTTTNSIAVKIKKESNEKPTERKQIVQKVTSGSKVVFLEELTPFDQSRKEHNSIDFTSDEQILNDALKLQNDTDDQEVSDSKLHEVEIFPSRSFSGRSGHFEEQETVKSNFFSRSHEAELTVDDEDPVTHGIADSMSSESHVHETQQKSESLSDSNQKGIVPIQTVIYHDNYQKTISAAQPRSVSYSSISQTIEQPNAWSNSNAYHEAKQNVSDVLQPRKFAETVKTNSESEMFQSEPAKIYGEPEKIYSEPAKVYSQPAKVYGQPSKFYSEPAKVYSEPAKVYSEPAKIYSEPAKVYSVPAKTYWPAPITTSIATSTEINTTKQPNHRKVIYNLDRLPYDLLNAPKSDGKLLDSNKGEKSSSTDRKKNSEEEDDGSYRPEYDNPRITVTHRPTNKLNQYTENPEELYTPTPEQNYEVDESVSVKSNGRVHGVQPPSPSTVNPKDEAKVGYVFEGRNFRKYRVEEKTSDGFIVGEYGVVSHNDGSLRGVRYTADSNINPSLIHDALMKFLSL